MNELLRKVADVMRRCDEEYCRSHSVPPTYDDEWDDLLAEVEEACEVSEEGATGGVQGSLSNASAVGR